MPGIDVTSTVCTARQDAPGISGHGNTGHVTAANFLAVSSDGERVKA